MLHAPCQLYLISPPLIADLPLFIAQLQLALAGGPVAAFQLRLKGVADADILHVAAAIKTVLALHDVSFILNDRADLAQMCGADGVHLGQQDGDIASARKVLGPDIQIGVTCHDSRHLAMEAGEAGADYVAFGAFYPTQTKHPPAFATPDILTWWSNMAELPCVAIGGITVENAAPLVAAGADFIAVSAGVWQHRDGPKAAVEKFSGLLQRETIPRSG
jgi:thiamine-phosphate pyrophosphorylase